MKTIVELTPTEKEFLPRVVNNPHSKDHEKEAAQKILDMSKQTPLSGDGLAESDQKIIEKLNANNAGLFKSMIFFLAKAQPECWGYARLVDIRTQLENIVEELSYGEFQELRRSVGDAVECVENILNKE